MVALVGDGGMQFTLPELASAVEARAPVIVLVWNNRATARSRPTWPTAASRQIGVDIYTPDFVAIARGYGCHADRAASPEHLRELLLAARGRDLPTLVEVREGDCFPPA